MVLDNVDTTALFDLQTGHSQPLIWNMPRTSIDRVLVTTQFQGCADRVTKPAGSLADHVTPMGPEEAVSLFRKALPNDSTAIAVILELAKALDYLPLAIKQAAAYVRNRQPHKEL